MSEVSLYRKYRPQTFDDVVGQETIVGALRQAVENKSFSHAYLFSGSRGTGKTSVARIFARAIGVDDYDLYEMDAASNRGIDDIRELRESVHTQPFKSPYKVYIIDEVHMLSKEAFNALLKTLEEPPPYVVFILATTEIEKIPQTILSRCTQFVFNQPTIDTLIDVVLSISKKEGVVLSRSSAELVAILGDNSFRDTLSVLQKVLSARDSDTPSDEGVSLLLGAPRSDLLSACLMYISNRNTEGVLEMVERIKDSGVDVRLFHKLLLMRLRAVLLLRYGNNFIKEEIAKSYSREDFEMLSKHAKESKVITSELLREFLLLERDISVASVKTLPIEILFIRLFEERAE